MDGTRSALIVASDQYTDPGLRRLRAPASDARALAAVLRDPGIGGFEVRTLLNEPAHVVNLAVEEFFADRQPGDLLLVHFSCHGVKDADGELYFSTSNTVLGRLGATAVAAEFVSRRMSRSRSRRVVLLLDCCYAGAFERGLVARAGTEMGIEQQFGGRGRAVITASSAMEYAFEAGELADTGEVAPSVFTSALVEGLESGEADRDQDGLVGLDELYDYIYDKVRTATPNQTPGKWAFGVEGELYIARRARPVTVPAPLPPGLQQAIDSPLAGIRAGAVQELAGVLRGRHAGMTLAAQLALEQLTGDDSRAVAAAAAAALGGQAPPELELSATVIDLGRLPLHGQSPERQVRIGNAGGGDLNARATSSASWLKLRQAGDELVVAADTSAAGRHEGTITVDSDGGTATIRVRARVDPAPLPASQAAATTNPEPAPETPAGAGSDPQRDLAMATSATADAAADGSANAANVGDARLGAGEVDLTGAVARGTRVAARRLWSISNLMSRLVRSEPHAVASEKGTAVRVRRSHRSRPERAARTWFRRPIVTASLVLLLAVIIGGYFAWRWSQDQRLAAPGCTALPYTAPTSATMAAGTVDCFRLTVAAGDVVRVRTTGNSLSGNLEMIDPRGKSLCSESIGQSTFDCTAGPAGTYTIMVSDYDNKFSGAYRVWAQRLNDPVGCTALSYTAPTSATMAAGTVDCFRLTVAAGDVVRVRTTGNSLSGNLEMIDPRGKSLCSESIGQSTFDCTAGPAGTYTIMVSDYDNKFSGAYRVWAQRLNDPVGCTALSYTAPTSATMAAGTVDCFRLTVAAGDVVRVRTTGNSLSGNLEMIDPRGKSLCSESIGQSTFDCTAGPAGTYTIMVSDYDNKFSGAYRVWAQRLNDPVGCTALSYTAPTSATMAAGTVDCFRLTVAAGDVVRVRTTGNSLSGNLEMIDPRGKSLCSESIGQSTFDCTAGPAGTYTIMVSDYDNKFSGKYVVTASKKRS